MLGTIFSSPTISGSAVTDLPARSLSATPTAALIGLPLIAPDHRACFQQHRIGGQIRHDEAGVEGAHLAALIFTHQEFDAVPARSQREAGIVVEIACRQPFSVSLAGSLTLMKSRTLAHDVLALVDHLADEVELGLAAAPFSRQRDYRTRDSSPRPERNTPSGEMRK